MLPITNHCLSQEQLNQSEKFYPIRVNVCEKCFLVQIEDIESREYLFSDGNYSYFSSYSDSWLKYVKAYSDMIVEKLELNQNSQVWEIAIDPWTQSLIGVIRLEGENPAELYLDYLEEKYR